MKLYLLIITLCITVIAKGAEPDRKATFVIVHGATAGGWEWKEVGQFLTKDGNSVYRATLTGLGERTHLAGPDVNLTTHINDVVNLILFEDLHDVVLVGHSYGGMVITGVMDKIPDRIRHVIYLDAIVPEDGQSAFDVVGGLPPKAKVVDGLVQFPWYDPSAKLPHGVPQPIKTFQEPVSYKNPAAKALSVTYVAFVPDEHAKEERKKSDKNWKVAKGRGWKIRTLTGTHIAHVTYPRNVATLLEEAQDDQNLAPSISAPAVLSK